MDNNQKIRVRFAPSPTGFLHVGGFRTALYDYLFAKKNQGDILLRIEDTDKKRYVEGSVEKIIEALNWAGIEYDEGPKFKEDTNGNANVTESKSFPGIFEVGDYGPYIQSERLGIYKKYVMELVEKGHAYYCFCEPKRLEEARKQQMAEKKPAKYDRYCLLNLKPEEINQKLKENCSYTIRMKIPEGETLEAEDIVRGKVKFKTDLVDDQVLLKSDGFPTYHLANVVDDHFMGITHVIRGEEWLSSLPKHLLLYKYFGWEPPKFAHLPLLLNTDKSKLSKRQGDVAVEDYVKKGYLKEALINFVALLGWNPGGGETQEIFSVSQLIKKFELEKVHKAGAVFDLKKLDWINSQYIKKMSGEELYEKVLPFFEQKDFYIEAEEARKSKEYIIKILEIEKERMEKLSDAGEGNRFFFQDFEPQKEMLRWKEMTDEELKKSLEKSQAVLENISEGDWQKNKIEEKLIQAAGDKKGGLLWPLRVALTGAEKSPSPFEVAWALGKMETLKRIKKAMDVT